METIECHSCHRKLPRDHYYNSNLNRGYIFCKDCCKEWNKEAKKRYRQKRSAIKNYAETSAFDKIFGGYTISMLYTPKKGEYKYSITSTKTGQTLLLDNESELENYFFKALKDVQNGQKKD